MSITEAQHVYIIGIGGIGISALARMLVHRGVRVSGANDSESPETLNDLREQGVEIDVVADGEVPDLPSDADAFIYSVAWEERGPTLLEAARATGKPVLSYFEALGEISRDYKTIAVSGTHGKTTTTAMLALALREAGLDSTAIVGSLVDWGAGERSNFLAGAGEYLIIEACEYKRHFLNFTPHLFVITNIEWDHPDYYRDLEDVQDAFRTMVSQSDRVVCNLEEPNLEPVIGEEIGKVIDAANYLEAVPDLKVIGNHNRKNAALILATADALNADREAVSDALATFAGTWRRLEYRGKTTSGSHVYDDYAHHPTEIKATLAAVKQRYPDARIIAVFEPHMFSRTKALLNEFAQSFTDAHEIVIAPIYPARESDDGTISARILADHIREHNEHVQPTDTLEEAVRVAAERGGKGSAIVFLSAGDIFMHIPAILEDNC